MYESEPFYEIKSSFFTLTENNISIEAKEKLTIGIIGNVYEKILLLIKSESVFFNSKFYSEVYKEWIISSSDLIYFTNSVSF